MTILLSALASAALAFDSPALNVLAPNGAPAVPAIGATREAPTVAAPEVVDLSGQFPPGKVPDQGAIGDCHDFAAVGLTEAAYFRHFHEHVAFSEEDLFVRSKLCTGAVCNYAGVYRAINGSVHASLGEGGDIHQDLLFILGRGVEKDGVGTPYAAFESEYVKGFQAKLEAALLKLDAKGQKLPAMAPGKLDKLAARLEDAPPDAEAQRAAARAALEGFSARTIFSAPELTPMQLWSLTPQACTAASAAQARALLSELKAGRPVAVRAQLLGLASFNRARPSPNGPPNGTNNHVFLAVGYRRDDSGNLSFQTRNSWVRDGKPFDPDLLPQDLCHVHGLETLLTPEEANPPPEPRQ